MSTLENLDDTLAPIVAAMKEKFLKYWDDVPVVTIIANCLHPAFKKKYTIMMLQRYNRNLELPTDNVESHVTSLLEEMFNIYNVRRTSNLPASSSQSSRPRSSSFALLNELRQEEGLDSQQMNNNELMSYCLGSMEDDAIDILDYWRRNAISYPTLAMMARDIFAVPVSTVPSESCFSSANRILSDKRTKLGPRRFEQLVCLKDWIDAEDRMQHDPAFVQATAAIETQESGTDRSQDDDSDGGCDTQYNDLWYMNNEF